MAPEPLVKTVVVEEKPKSFLESMEEFPDLKKKETKHKEQSNDTTSVNSTNTSTKSTNTDANPSKRIVKNAPTCIGGDFNFLEDDGWLDGDDIDYSQNLFQDTEHFLFFPTSEINNSITANTNVCNVKAKTLLAERTHSSSKLDIWKRSENNNAAPSQTKFKILKRPSESASATEIVQSSKAGEMGNKNTPAAVTVNVVVKKFSTSASRSTETETQQSASINHPTTVTSSNASTTAPDSTAKLVKKFSTSLNLASAQAPKEEVTHGNKTKPGKIVYSSASKKLERKQEQEEGESK